MPNTKDCEVELEQTTEAIILCSRQVWLYLSEMTFPLLKNPSNYLIEGGMGHARSSCFRVRHFVFFRHAQDFIGLAIGIPKTTSTVCGHSSKACHGIDCEVSEWQTRSPWILKETSREPSTSNVSINVKDGGYELITICNYFFPRD